MIFRTIFGNLAVGPTAEEQTSRTDASTEAGTLRDLQAKGIEMLPDLAKYEVTTVYAGPASSHRTSRLSDFAKCRAKLHHGWWHSLHRSECRAWDRPPCCRAECRCCASTAHRPAPPVCPPPDRLSEYHRRDWQDAGHGGIICHCEMVTRREIMAALNGPMPPATLQGFKAAHTGLHGPLSGVLLHRYAVRNHRRSSEPTDRRTR